MDGAILGVEHKVGERIRGSEFSEDVVMLMGGLSDMEVKAEGGEHEVVGIHVGDETTVEIDAIADKQFKGHVAAGGTTPQIKNPGTGAAGTSLCRRAALRPPPESGVPRVASAVSIARAR